MSNIFALLPIYCYSYADNILGQAGFGATAAMPFAVNIANLVLRRFRGSLKISSAICNYLPTKSIITLSQTAIVTARESLR